MSQIRSCLAPRARRPHIVPIYSSGKRRMALLTKLRRADRETTKSGPPDVAICGSFMSCRMNGFPVGFDLFRGPKFVVANDGRENIPAALGNFFLEPGAVGGLGIAVENGAAGGVLGYPPQQLAGNVQGRCECLVGNQR